MDDPIGRHQAEAPDVVAGGDPAAIKRLYVDLGSSFAEAHQSNLRDVPVLSAPETAPVVEELLDGVRGVVLDAGCGPNPAVSVTLGRRYGISVVAVDLGWGTAKVARAVAAQQGVRITAVAGDVEALPFRAYAFAAVVCDDTLEHLPDDEAGVAELTRVLGPGGRMVIATPNRDSLQVIGRRIRDLFRGRRRPPRDYFVSTSHLREYSWRELEALLPPAVQLRRRAVVGWNGGWKRRVASLIAAAPGLHRLAQMVVVEVEKAQTPGSVPS